MTAENKLLDLIHLITVKTFEKEDEFGVGISTGMREQMVKGMVFTNHLPEYEYLIPKWADGLFMGIPFVVCKDMPDNIIRFVDVKAGEIVGEIINLDNQ